MTLSSSNADLTSSTTIRILPCLKFTGIVNLNSRHVRYRTCSVPCRTSLELRVHCTHLALHESRPSRRSFGWGSLRSITRRAAKLPSAHSLSMDSPPCFSLRMLRNCGEEVKNDGERRKRPMRKGRKEGRDGLPSLIPPPAICRQR